MPILVRQLVNTKAHLRFVVWPMRASVTGPRGIAVVLGRDPGHNSYTVVIGCIGPLILEYVPLPHKPRLPA